MFWCQFKFPKASRLLTPLSDDFDCLELMALNDDFHDNSSVPGSVGERQNFDVLA
jgi:hypothetical protein